MENFQVIQGVKMKLFNWDLDRIGNAGLHNEISNFRFHGKSVTVILGKRIMSHLTLYVIFIMQI